MIIDKIRQNSFHVVNGESIHWKTGAPYSWHHSIENKTTMGPVAYPFCFEGDFINWGEWDELPKEDYDVIFLTIEKLPEKYNIGMVRKTYPNALIVGTIKELYFIHSYEQRVEFFNLCDIVVVPYQKSIYTYFPNLQKDVNKTIYYLPQPYDVNYLYDKFYKEERNETIFSYVAHHPPRWGATEQFAKAIGEKYNIPVVRQRTEFSPTQWHDFLNIFTKSTFCFNLDPEPQQGQQGIQSAILGVVNIGGVNDSHFTLFPETANNDVIKLEKLFYEYFTNYDKRVEIINYAWEKVNEIYSFSATRKRFKKIIDEREDAAIV